MSESKRFEDWEQVECNECARYWDSSCDGVNKDSKKPCNSYLATRSIVLPEKIKKLDKRVRWLELILGIECVILGILLLVGWLIG